MTENNIFMKLYTIAELHSIELNLSVSYPCEVIQSHRCTRSLKHQQSSQENCNWE